jgi:hypothetical protein
MSQTKGVFAHHRNGRETETESISGIRFFDPTLPGDKIADDKIDGATGTKCAHTDAPGRAASCWQNFFPS